MILLRLKAHETAGLCIYGGADVSEIYRYLSAKREKRVSMSQRRTKKSWKIVTAEEGTVMGTTESRTERRCFL